MKYKKTDKRALQKERKDEAGWESYSI